MQDGGIISKYTTPLPHTVTLQGRWESALTEIFIPHAWNNVDESSNMFEYYEGEGGEGLPPTTPPAKFLPIGRGWYDVGVDAGFMGVLSHVTEEERTMMQVRIPRGYYNTIQEVLHAIHDSMTELGRRNIHIVYNMDRTISINCVRKSFLQLSQPLADMLGFVERKIEGRVVGEYASDEKRGLYSALVYTDIILPQLIGNVQAQVLRFVPIDGKPGKLMVHRFPNPDYVPLARHSIDSIEIDIRTDHGAPLVFQYGKILCKLHFRPCRQ